MYSLPFGNCAVGEAVVFCGTGRFFSFFKELIIDFFHTVAEQFRPVHVQPFCAPVDFFHGDYIDPNTDELIFGILWMRPWFLSCH